jgi:hypothetical protein
MAKLTWKVAIGATDITSLVRSIEYSFGRSNAVSAYGPNSLAFTMTNTNNGASLPSVQDLVYVSVKTTGAYQDAFVGRVTQRNFNDGTGSALNSTCTIVLVDSIEPLGTLNDLDYAPVADTDVLSVISSLSYYGSLSGITDTPMTAPAYENALALSNNVIAGDRGVVRYQYYDAPSEFPTLVRTAFTFGPSTSATQIGYQNFNRTEGSSNGTFFTSATVTDSTTTTSANAANVLYYGQRFLSVTTAINFTDDTADWYANVFSDPTSETLTISWNDIGQNSAALDLTIQNLFQFGPGFFTVSYTPPGGVLKTAYYWTEQLAVSVTVDLTTVTMLMSPITYYANFILDDPVFGVLGGSPVYDSAIDYNEIAYTYNDSNAEQGNRLGVQIVY